MKRFQFQLQTALEWRRRRMEQERLRHEEMLSRLEAIEAQIAQSEQNFMESRRVTLESAALTATELTALAEYRDAVDLRKQRLRREAAKLATEIEQQHVVMVEATRQFRLLEKLRGRRFDEWRKDCDREVEAEAGDLYLAKWNRDAS